ncbi:acetamidase/formamidase family protein [Paenibacillus glycanilyticus]|uniref:acetamidase/formamidase family protein n=1 Tax=Paenibacillus glycanilyticus TaxID=126569 RepID=UPI0020421EA8|nr:acetamidase/formamidase family protein [Paenibacillus glycanilyticus]MCM3629866.1 acetamidase/formamidase family protein [Paenibacillus glycanilyticus]
MQTVSKEQFVYSFSKDNSHALKVPSGSTIVMETWDCFRNQIQSEQTTVSSIDWEQINPATGPIYVEGAKPGDLLKVHIDAIELGEQGLMAAGPGLGVMGHRLDAMQFKLIPIKDGKAIFNDKLHLPLNPMIGVIGVAPEDEAVPCGTPGPHGGNMDTKLITTGATLYLPVFQEGALFGLGDVHAAMGDGEIGVTGIEIPAKVTVTLEVLSGQSIPYPFLENGEGISSIVSKETLDEAAKSAVEIMIDALLPHMDMSLPELVMLCSAAGQSQISQIVDPLMTARFFMPWSVLDVYGVNLFKPANI